jgi:hypothetical protein
MTLAGHHIRIYGNLVTFNSLILRGQSHEKVIELRAWGVSLGPN